MKVTPYSRRANYYETDQMAIVHHTNYLRYFEEARLDLMRQLDCSAADLEKIGIIIPNVDAYAKYLKLLHFEDEFTVVVKPVQFSGVKMRFEYEVVKDGEVYCTGYTTHCFVNRDMKPVALQRSFPEVYEKVKALFDSLEF